MPLARLVTALSFALLTTAAAACGSDGDTQSPDAATADGGADAAPASPTPFPWSPESTDQTCSDAIDNDGNTFTDCGDFGCSRNRSVTVCDAEARYEHSPALCGNGMDDDGDGLRDCADPDCFKNPFHDVCTKPVAEPNCSQGTDGDGDGLTDCDDYDCLITDASCDRSGYVRILFDQTLDETAAAGPNSDWVVDAWGRLPAPSNPAVETDWSGALSTFAFELHKQGDKLIENLPSWDGRLTLGDATNPQDLSNYDLLVLVEPSRKIAPEEAAAVVGFVQGGGRLLLVANHLGADRDGNGYSAPQALNEMLADNPFGFLFDEVDRSTSSALSGIVDAGHAIIDGPHGTVSSIGFYNGCTAHLTTPPAGVTVQPLILLSGSDTSANIVALAAQVGTGRVVAVTDSAILGDGTDSHGNVNTDKNAWDDFDDAPLFLNAVSWLLSP